MEFQKKKVLIVGTGLSGIAAASLLYQQGCELFLFDANEKANEATIREKLRTDVSAQVLIGQLPDQIRMQIEIVVVSPGVPTDQPLIMDFKARRVPVIGEIELAFLLGKGRVIGITGTNGKTTTTALTGAIMEAYFDSAFVVGNIGIPYTQVVSKLQVNSVITAEISSFQLETIHSFHPTVTAILNVTPDHLDRHHTMENYIKAKMDITMNQGPDEYCVLNYDNEITRKMAEKITCKPFYFSVSNALEKGVYFENDCIYYADGQTRELICKRNDLQLLGMHNIENAMAAAAIAIAMKIPMDIIRATITSFQSVEHRIERVQEINGVVYYNDSKGTNTDAAIKGIEAMTRPTVLLAGGYDKQSDYDDWIKACVGKVKCLVLIGQTKEKIKMTAEKYGIHPIALADTFEEAMQLCVSYAKPGDAVLLSPACASWGMFENYEQRGKMFKEYVRTKVKDSTAS